MSRPCQECERFFENINPMVKYCSKKCLKKSKALQDKNNLANRKQKRTDALIKTFGQERVNKMFSGNKNIYGGGNV